MDRAGWHKTDKLKVPENLTIILLPSRAPELNPVENVWQFLRQNWLSNTVFENYGAILDAGCDAWRKLIAMPDAHQIHRATLLDTRRSIILDFGISAACPDADVHCVAVDHPAKSGENFFRRR
jgi:hypothetical protein